MVAAQNAGFQPRFMAKSNKTIRKAESAEGHVRKRTPQENPKRTSPLVRYPAAFQRGALLCSFELLRAPEAVPLRSGGVHALSVASTASKSNRPVNEVSQRMSL